MLLFHDRCDLHRRVCCLKGVFHLVLVAEVIVVNQIRLLELLESFRLLFPTQIKSGEVHVDVTCLDVVWPERLERDLQRGAVEEVHVLHLALVVLISVLLNVLWDQEMGHDSLHSDEKRM